MCGYIYILWASKLVLQLYFLKFKGSLSFSIYTLFFQNALKLIWRNFKEIGLFFYKFILFSIIEFFNL